MDGIQDDRCEILSDEVTQSKELSDLQPDSDDDFGDKHGNVVGSVASRLRLLKEAGEMWQERVPQNDKEEAANLTAHVKTRRLKQRAAHSVFLEREASLNEEDQKYPLKPRARTNVSNLSRRGSSYSKKEREAKYRAQLSDEPIKLADTSAIKVPEVPWASSTPTKDVNVNLKQVMKQSLQKRPQSEIVSPTFTNEVPVFDPSSSSGLNAFFEAASVAVEGDAATSPAVHSEQNTTTGSVLDDSGFVNGSSASKVEIEVISLPSTIGKDDIKSLPTKGPGRIARPARQKQRPPTKVAAQANARSSYIESQPPPPQLSLAAVPEKPKKPLPGAMHVQGMNPAQRQSIMADEAVQALAATENLGSVRLKSMESNKKRHQQKSLNPFNNSPMLIMVKGRYHVQVRLVEPSARSMSESDCFLLVTKQDLIVWKGSVSNVVEQNKAMELGKLICDRRDLGCEAVSFDVVESGRGTANEKLLKRKFFSILSKASGRQESESGMLTVGEDTEAEDVWFEDCVTATNKVYRVDTSNNNAALMPLVDSSCCALPHSLLQSGHTLLFDFGSEVYVWFGKDASFRDRSIAPLLLNQLVNAGYNYRSRNPETDKNDYVLCPLYPLDDHAPLYADTRPAWIICGKVNENMETVLFSHKFADWPEKNFMKEIRTSKNYSDQKWEKIDLNPIQDYDFRELMKADDPLSKGYVVEAVNVGRGDYWKDPIELRAHKVITTGVKCWPILDGELKDPLDSEVDHIGLFRDDEIYIVRWSFYTEVTGIKTLKGVRQRDNATKQPPKEEKIAYFFWQGKRATKIDLGTSALKVVDLDLEGGKQIRVAQHEEPPAFLRLFTGHFVVQSSLVLQKSSKWRVFYVQGAFNEERHLIEVEDSVSDYVVRPYLCYVIISTDSITPQCYIIKSPHCSNDDVLFAKKQTGEHLFLNRSGRCLVRLVSSKVPVEEVKWADVPKKLGFLSQSLPRSFLKIPADSCSSKRMVLLTSVTKKAGNFAFQEVHTLFHGSTSPCSLPFLQSQLYSHIQPAFLLFDCGTHIFLWQGLAALEETTGTGAVEEEKTRESGSVSPLQGQGEIVSSNAAGSVNRRFIAERKRAMETVANYAKERKVAASHCYYVEAGKEPRAFTLLFPVWTSSPSDEPAPDFVTIETKTKEMASLCYSIEVLKSRPLPTDVDPLRIEDYLGDGDFEKLFKMSRAKFEALPQWRKTDMKKKVDLF